MATKLRTGLLLHREPKERFGRATEKDWRCFVINAYPERSNKLFSSHEVVDVPFPMKAKFISSPDSRSLDEFNRVSCGALYENSKRCDIKGH